MSETISESGVTVLYVRYPNGTVGQITAGDGVTADLDPDAELITQQEYEVAVAALQQQLVELEQETRAEEQAAVKVDYEALRAAGVSEVTARRLTGYTG